ncbi:Inositol-1-monophosphatase [Anaerohalosphaera lusitana]|uniref:Inositol-1-monophosphatase n=1 Tax=Anaerohalosphaera lusitana TaxID=1936003 RepID=A0A1U9NKS1_9BACT|nr:inositol monophosphatase [Anaerohalosphaera lusitana]AQT68531.1 Inositol-1-monophosphatase [Anaerohalosphaera lusitana]
MEHAYLSRLLEVATVAARLAGQRAMEEIKYTKTSIKNENEIVTSADPLCQRIIIDRIQETFPDHGFIAEEGDDGSMLFLAPRTREPIWWVIDPIDGTANFSHGILHFTVSVAAMHNGEPVVGAVFEPSTDSMFTAVKDDYAQLNYSRIGVSSEKMSSFTSVAIDSHFPDSALSSINELMQNTRFRALGSAALNLSYVANGGLVAALASTAKIWDIAAAALIVECAGGKVTTLAGEPLFPMDLDKYEPAEVSILASNGKVHKEIVDMFSD